MSGRINYGKAAPEGIRALSGLDGYVQNTGLETCLLDLVRVRESQLNGCGYCIDMHTKDARAGGETEQRLCCLSAWHEAPFYAGWERAALTWTDAITRIGDGPVPDALYEEIRQRFADKELVDLTLGVIAINAWNRLGIAFRAEPGRYQPMPRPRAGTRSLEGGAR